MAKQRRQELKKALSLYLTHLQDMAIAVSGRDIEAMGLRPGPEFSIILQTVKRAVLNNEARTREEQLLLARSLVEELQRQPADHHS